MLGVARLAGIMGAKKNAELIPLCHIVPLTNCEVTFTTDENTNSITAVCTTSCVGKTGVEMEALTGVSTALLTIYDMCKAMDRGMVIRDIHILEKRTAERAVIISIRKRKNKAWQKRKISRFSGWEL